LLPVKVAALGSPMQGGIDEALRASRWTQFQIPATRQRCVGPFLGRHL